MVRTHASIAYVGDLGGHTLAFTVDITMARSKKSRTAANYALESTTESELVRSRMMTLTDAYPSGDMALPATIAGATAPDGVVRPPSKTARVSRRRLRQNVEEILASTVFEKPAEKSSEPRDLTSYQEELAVVKKKLASALKSKTTLQAQTIRLEKEVQKQSKQFDTLLRNAVESNGGNVERSEILETLRLEKCRSTGLSAKVQSLEAERAALQKKVDSIQESVKFSNVRELKIQNKAYFNEARRLRALAQKMAAQERIIDKDINKRIKEKTDLLQSSMDEDRQQMLVAHKSLESTLNDLRHRATSLSILAEDEKSENAALKKALDAVNEHQKSSQVLQLTFQAQMAELQASLERKQSDLERTQANVDLLQKKLDDLTGQLVDERKASAIHSETVAKLTATIDSMTLKSNADLEQLRVQMEGKDAVVELHRQEVARSSELQETIARLQGQLSAESGSATLVAERCEKLEAQIKDVDARLHHAKQELDRAMENETTLRQTIADLETKREFEAAQATARINALQADLDAARAALTSQLAAGNDTVAALTLEIEALKTQLDKAAADAAALKADQAAALEKASMALAQERESSDQRVADLQRQLEAAQATAAGERAALQRTFDAELAAERASAASRADNDKETAVKFEQERATLQAKFDSDLATERAALTSKFDSDLAAQKALLTEQFDRDLTAARNESSGLSQKQGEEALQESLTLQKRLQTEKDALQEQVGHLQTQLDDGKAQRARDAQASDEQRQLMTAQIAEHANAIADLKSQLSKESASVAAKEAELLTYVKFAKADSEQIQDLKAQLESSQNEVARLRARVAEAASAQPPAVLPAPEPVQAVPSEQQRPVPHDAERAPQRQQEEQAPLPQQEQPHQPAARAEAPALQHNQQEQGPQPQQEQPHQPSARDDPPAVQHSQQEQVPQPLQEKPQQPAAQPDVPVSHHIQEAQAVAEQPQQPAPQPEASVVPQQILEEPAPPPKRDPQEQLVPQQIEQAQAPHDVSQPNAHGHPQGQKEEQALPMGEQQRNNHAPSPEALLDQGRQPERQQAEPTVSQPPDPVIVQEQLTPKQSETVAAAPQQSGVPVPQQQEPLVSPVHQEEAHQAEQRPPVAVYHHPEPSGEAGVLPSPLAEKDRQTVSPVAGHQDTTVVAPASPVAGQQETASSSRVAMENLGVQEPVATT